MPQNLIFFPISSTSHTFEKKMKIKKTCEAQIKLAADAKMFGEAQMKMKRKNRDPALSPVKYGMEQAHI